MGNDVLSFMRGVCLSVVFSCGVRFVIVPGVSQCVGLCALLAQRQVPDNHYEGVCAAVRLTFCSCKQVVRIGFASEGARELGHRAQITTWTMLEEDQLAKSFRKHAV